MADVTPSPPPLVPPVNRLVVGCGYLGGRVARRWLAAGDRVFAVTRSPERAGTLAAEGLVPVLHDVASTETSALSSLPALDTILWAVGFDRTGGATARDVHVAGLLRLLDAIRGRGDEPRTPRTILSSSTGVWGDEGGGVVDESTPVNPGREAGRVLVEAEAALRAHPRGPGVALRFAGLYGPGRLPRIGELRAGTPIAADPDSWLNLIHVDDAADAVITVAAAPAPRPLYLVSDGRPVRRGEWYAALARLTDSPPPTWDPAAPRTRGADKRVDSSLLRNDLGFHPRHPDAIDTMAELLAAG